MQRDTNNPDELKQLFAALANDTQRTGEYVAKPPLAERIPMDQYAYDEAA